MKKRDLVKSVGTFVCVGFLCVGTSICGPVEGDNPLGDNAKNEPVQINKKSLVKKESCVKEVVLDLHYAAKIGSEEIVRDFIVNGAFVNKQDEHGRTALHYAAKYGYEKLVTVLLKNKADVAIADKWGETAQDLAEKKGYGHVGELLQPEIAPKKIEEKKDA